MEAWVKLSAREWSWTAIGMIEHTLESVRKPVKLARQWYKAQGTTASRDALFTNEPTHIHFIRQVISTTLRAMVLHHNWFFRLVYAITKALTKIKHFTDYWVNKKSTDKHMDRFQNVSKQLCRWKLLIIKNNFTAECIILKKENKSFR